MGRTLVPRYFAALDLTALHDAELHVLISNILQAAKTSALVLANPQMVASVADLAIKDGNLTAADQEVADDRAKLRADFAAAAVARSDAVGAVRVFAALTSTVARSPADVHSVGLTDRPPRSPKGQAPPVPESIDNKPPRRGRGQTTVSVHETGPIHYEYAAEQSLDGVTWVQLGVGRGKTRVVTGASGAEVWVRFATVRGQLQSAWCTPTLITIP